MKKILYSLLLLLAASSFLAQAQEAAVKIDGKLVYLKAGNSLPYWLSAGQTIAPAQNISFLSAMQFSADSASHSLKFDQVFKIANLSTVPAGKAWKIEAIAYDTLIAATNLSTIQVPSNGTYSSGGSGGSTANTPILYQSPKVFSTAGTCTWVDPPGVTSICIEIGGGGGNGGGVSSSSSYIFGGGGGAGAYAYQCFTVVPGTSLTINVGASGSASSVVNLITALPGANGITATNSNQTGAGGAGGTSTASFSVAGGAGTIGGINNQSGAGGKAYNGGAGGVPQSLTCSLGAPGTAPGGGGSGAVCQSSMSFSGGAGAPGQVIIYW